MTQKTIDLLKEASDTLDEIYDRFNHKLNPILEEKILELVNQLDAHVKELVEKK
jgi:hypothetical protein